MQHCGKGPENCDECETVRCLREHVGPEGVELIKNAQQCLRSARAFIEQIPAATLNEGSEFADTLLNGENSLLETFNWFDEALTIALRVSPEQDDGSNGAKPPAPAGQRNHRS